MTCENNKQSFVMYGSFFDAAMGLNDEEFREYMLRLKDHALYGDNDMGDNVHISSLLFMAYPLLDAAEKRRKAKVGNGQKGAEYGQLGGRPRKGETASEYRERKLQEQKTPNETPTITPNETANKPLNVNANVNENDNENANGNVNANWNANAEETEADAKRENISLPTSLVFSHQGFEDSKELDIELKGPLQEVSDDSNDESSERTERVEAEAPISSKPLEVSPTRYGTVRLEMPPLVPWASRQERVRAVLQYAMTRREDILNEPMDDCSYAANDILDNYAPTVRGCFRHILFKGKYEEEAMEKICGFAEDEPDEVYMEIVFDLFKYAIKSGADTAEFVDR